MDNIFSLHTIGELTDINAGTNWPVDKIRSSVSAKLKVLKEKGIGSGDIVVIAHGGTPEFFTDLFSVWLQGACAVCLNAALTKNELLNVNQFVQPKLVLITDGQSDRLEGSSIPFINLSDAHDELIELPEMSLARLDDPALILFTSGTTGDPKGVVHTFRSLSERLQHNRQYISQQVLANTLCVLPTHFGHGLIGNCLTPLSAGKNLFLFQNPGVSGSAKLGKVIDEHNISFMSSVASFWKVALKVSPKPSLKTLKQVSVGSAPLSRELWLNIIDWAGTDNVYNMYGITETANWAAGASAADYAPKDGLVGKMWGGEVAVMTAEGRKTEFGEGEILLKPPSLMYGYFERADLTGSVIKEGWYYTGDWGELDEEGVIQLKGRTKTEINKAGIKILPEEIDLLLEGHPAINEACAFAVPDAISGETVAAAICFKEDENVHIAELRQWCGERIRPDGIPDKWYVLAEIPKTDRGKVNRQLVYEYCLKNE